MQRLSSTGGFSKSTQQQQSLRMMKYGTESGVPMFFRGAGEKKSSKQMCYGCVAVFCRCVSEFRVMKLGSASFKAGNGSSVTKTHDESPVRWSDAALRVGIRRTIHRHRQDQISIQSRIFDTSDLLAWGLPKSHPVLSGLVLSIQGAPATVLSG
eukprot:2572585-Amphidinium_carterae.1